MATMYGESESGQRCKEYLTELVGNINDDKLVFWPHKSKLVVNDTELFNRVTQALNVKELRNLGGLNYSMDVPRAENIPEHWTVVLYRDYTQEFLTKYGEQYKII